MVAGPGCVLPCVRGSVSPSPGGIHVTLDVNTLDLHHGIDRASIRPDASRPERPRLRETEGDIGAADSIAKDLGGEVAIARRDTVTVYRTRVDTVVSYRADTVRMRGRVDTLWSTVTRYDTVTVAAIATPSVQRVLSGLYFGLGAGTTSPTGSLFQANNAGIGAQGQLGWNAAEFPLGLRADVNYARFGQDAAYAQTHVNGRLVTGNADLRLGLPVLTHLLGLSPRFGLYGIGGLTYASYQNLQMDMDVCCGTGPTNTSSPSSGNKLGWNAGGGATLRGAQRALRRIAPHQLQVPERARGACGANPPRNELVLTRSAVENATRGWVTTLVTHPRRASRS